MNISRTLKEKSKPIVRSFLFSPGNAAKTTLKAWIEYVGPNRTKEIAEQERTRIIGQTRFNKLQDQREQAEALERLSVEIVAMPIKKVEAGSGGPVTLRHLAGLIGGLGVEAIKAMGGLDKPVAFDTESEEPAAEEDRVGDDGERDDKIKTVGDVARRNIVTLVREHPRFLEWALEIANDPGFFQDRDWEEQLKNSSAPTA